MINAKFLRAHPELKNNKLSHKNLMGVDLSTIPKEDWLDGLIIFRSSLPATSPGEKTIPEYFKGTFVGCNINNHELHTECSQEQCSNIHFIVANNFARFTTTKDSNYTALGDNLDTADFLYLGLDPSASAVPAERLPENIIHRADRMMTYAKANNIKEFNVFGEILTNPEWDLLIYTPTQ